MRVLVIHAHPVAESFNGALHRLAVETLKAKGHEVDDCDLYAEKFDPVMSRDERVNYHDLSVNTANVRGYVERVRAAEALVLCFPVWNYGFPAIMKGYFDRVFLPGVSFGLDAGKIYPMLHNIRSVTAIATYGGSWLRTLVAGDPPRKIVKRSLRFLVKPGAPVRYLVHYSMNVSTDASRAGFMSKVANTLSTV
jgi:putative NADPH-quinone reductase